MTDQNNTTVGFVQFRRPPLPDGDYTVTVAQHIQAQPAKDAQGAQPIPADPAEDFKTSLTFTVLGPRFNLDPQLIEGVFPPEGSLGDHANVLPHILLGRSTLPWERSPLQGATPDPTTDPVGPWLALLLFDDDDKVVTCTEPLDQLNIETGNPAYLKTGTAENAKEMLTVIEVDGGTLQGIMPKLSGLGTLTHVRQPVDASGKPGDEIAVIICSRLPKPGGKSTVHLVSVEGRYKADGSFDGAGAGQTVRLVSLKSWRFACVSREQSFKQLVTGLKCNMLCLPKVLLDAVATPQHGEAVDTANTYLAMGCVPLPHAMRQGNRTVSWYHGPLAPARIKGVTVNPPVPTADALVRYNSSVGMFDVSYAAAWQLGRLLALSSRSFSTSLYAWKRSHARALKDAENRKNKGSGSVSSILADGAQTHDLPMPETVTDWLEHLALLEGVPFAYLVPDERMLPQESIRFFQVDQQWMDCLLDGAFSIGRVLTSDSKYDDQDRDSHPETRYRRYASGFLMRSDVVAGWPGLLVDGYDEMAPDADKAAKPLIDLQAQPVAQPIDSISGLRAKLTAIGISLNDMEIECRQWKILKAGTVLYDLLKRENHEIDVRTSDRQYLFSIDEVHEVDLNGGAISSHLQQVFEDKKAKDPLDVSCTAQPIAWFLTDNPTSKHYKMQFEGTPLNCLRVYRQPALPLLRMGRLSKNVLICLFEGIVQAVDIHLKPETLHFGLDGPDATHPQFYKNLKDVSVSIDKNNVIILEGPETDMAEVNKIETWLRQLQLLIGFNRLDRNKALELSGQLSTLLSEWNALDAFDTSAKSQISDQLNTLCSDLKVFAGSGNSEISMLVARLISDLEALKTEDKNDPTINSAEFAAEMIESGEAVRFIVSS